MVVAAKGDGFFSIVPPNSTDSQHSPTSKSTYSTDPLSTVEFVMVWFLVLALHGLCASYLFAMALLYFFMENPLMAYYTNLLTLPEHRYFRLFGMLVGILGALHGLQLVLHLLWSIKSRAPAVFPRTAIVNSVVRRVQRLKKTKRDQSIAPRTSWSRNSIVAISSATASVQNVLSVEGNHFALVFVTRKAVEVGAQIIQCYHYSTLIGRVWINHAYAGMVVTNCWVTPLLDHLMLASESQPKSRTSTRTAGYADIAIRERVVCVSIDALLTAFACLVLPLTVFVPYAQVFNASWYGFPYDILYGDVSFPNLIRENQALFALSFIDGVTKLVPHLSILLGMTSISLLLELYPPQKVKRVKSSPADRPQEFKAINVNKQSTQRHVAGLRLMRHIVVPLGFLTAGAVVLGLHLRAAHLAKTADTSTMKMCLQGLRPWFAVNVSCSVLKFNCYKQGVLTPASDQLDHLQSDAVMAVIFEHCPEFEMPPSIRRFRNLLGLELWNVSIVNWGEEAALNADLHPEMIFLIMVYTNMTELPRGVLTAPLPPLLGDIEISITNLTFVPDELADAWSNVRLVYLEHAPLKEFPTALFKIPSLSVSLIDDGLHSIPDDLFTTVSLLDEYLEIAFSYNPIKELPSSIKDGLLINYLAVDHTELKTLPAWVDGVGQWMNLGGSPVCNDTEAVIPDIGDCADRGWNPISDGRYPLALVAPLREIE
ncbi:hypothetical protein GN958_ATG04476 [Phytophthora infestans]|nr:hypothetical protein GN958_ATG04476 [Phytophthora infestans]